jgi:hypothetical protein
MFKRAIITGALVGVLLVTFLVSPLLPGTAEAAQQSPPYAPRFTACYPNTSPSCSGVDNDVWVERMGAVGYRTQTWWWGNIFGAQYSPSAYAAVLAMPDAAVVSFIGHAEPGYLQFYSKASGYPGTYSYIKADNGMPNPSGGTNYSLNEVADLWDCRLMVLTGCRTALSQNQCCDYRSLTVQAVNYKGVDCAVGFKLNIVISKALMWDDCFFQYLLYDGMNVGSAAASAAYDVYLNYGTYGYVDSYEVRGNSGICIKPAAYGT